MKKLTALLMMLCLGLFIVGCGGGDDAASDGTTPVTPAVDAGMPAADAEMPAADGEHADHGDDAHGDDAEPAGDDAAGDDAAPADDGAAPAADAAE